MDLGRIGVWSGGLRSADAQVADATAELEELGYSTLWVPGGMSVLPLDALRNVLGATRRIAVATGIVSVWETPAADAASGFAQLEAGWPGRFLLGLGVSHAPAVYSKEPGRYRRPVAVMREYLAALDAAPTSDAAPTPVPKGRRIVAALGPRMLELATAESLGTHPYLNTPAMTAALRERAGEAVIATEQTVILETDPAAARAAAREFLKTYLRLPNYVNNWLRGGFDSSDVEHGGSDRLVDEVLAWGGAEQVARRVAEHLDAGADHVCLQVIGAGQNMLPMAQWRELAEVLLPR